MELLGVGDRVLLELAALGDRFVGVVAGLRENDHLLIYVDLPAPARERLRNNPAVTVRFAVESALLGFPSRLLDSGDLPDGLLRVACPERILSMDRRSERRCPVRWPATLHRGAAQAPGLIRDVSASALRLALLGEAGETLYRAMAPGDVVRLVFHTLDPARPCQADCTVRALFLTDRRPFGVLAFNRSAAVLARLVADYVEAALGPASR